ncbi:sugar ABC transporter substrate-binding protein [Bacillus sp. FJAT-50079]|uniref:sugar ABC transporter substrate-binding protein n=1 Tax=Bacillus sp. FJAT-50079 TaxID=2833577 RepID=UPI001BCA3ABB|nr:sugar ABC transporter substrate-binding protein [Bacillus sp. FJAT-50079]MBS4208300.1 sugar ABC transporter substrate-binding protein [Bacillus sp. FJAT-50079]
MKRFTFLFLVALLTIGLVACNKEEASGSNGKGSKDQLVFGYTSMTQNNPFFQVLEEAIREKVEANGDKLITMNPAMDVELQINQIEDLISQGIDAIFLNPVDWEGIRPALVMLEEAGIPIINYDTEVKDFDYVTAYVGSDNKNAGRVVGQDLVERFPDGGKIVILDSPTMNSVNDRIDGFLEAIEGKNFEIVAQQDAKGDLEIALGLTEDILQAHSDFIAIMGGNDPTGLGALAALKAANRDDIVVYGVDGSPDAKAAIAEGGPFVGSGAQSPISIGQQSVDVAYKILNKEEFEKRIPVETFIINEDNVEEYGVDGWQ